MEAGGLSQKELKYCERCGGLWLREVGAEAAYCGRCLWRMRELPPPRVPDREMESRVASAGGERA